MILHKQNMMIFLLPVKLNFHGVLANHQILYFKSGYLTQTHSKTFLSAPEQPQCEKFLKIFD